MNANAVYQLPFGPDKPYLNQPGIVSSISGLWELTSTAIARSGFPVNVLVNRSSSSVPDGNNTDQLPDLIPGVSLRPPEDKSIGERFNPAAFAMPVSGTFGNAPRDIVRRPGAWQIDLGVRQAICPRSGAPVF